MHKVTIKIDRSSGLANSPNGIPVGKHSVRIFAYYNNKPSGNCVVNISKIHPEVPASVRLNIVDFPRGELEGFLVGRRMLQGMARTFEGIGIERATVATSGNSKQAIGFLSRFSSVLSPHDKIHNLYNINLKAGPLIKNKELIKYLREAKKRDAALKAAAERRNLEKFGKAKIVEKSIHSKSNSANTPKSNSTKTVTPFQIQQAKVNRVRAFINKAKKRRAIVNRAKRIRAIRRAKIP
ncbi:MAG: hypothetical protein GX950_02165 [Candidatus Diapherotrites archaeon]|uniref:Uncharacterized protein n=1 Tax=Candidatus Iainarchaeum sp. TaxID=3101447 RepID=A0A7K4BZH1_9ARCH|nr:hypothetical protein [Candidatus Diapherotrites archaeon]